MTLSNEFKAVLKGLGYDDQQIAAMESTSASAGKSTRPSVVTYPTVSGRTAADAKIIDQFNRLLDRDPTAAELKTWRVKLNEAQKKFASKQTYKRKGEAAEQATITGLDADFWLEQEISKDPEYKGEVKRLAILDPKVRERQKSKKEYDAAIKSAAGNPNAIAEIDQTTSYGLDISGLKDRIKSVIRAAGGSIDDATLTQVAKEAYDKNQDLDPVALNSFIKTKIRIPVGDVYTGQAAEDYQSLQELARNNGFKLSDILPKDALGRPMSPEMVLQRLASGDLDINGITQSVRKMASVGQSDMVKDLLNQGYNLADVYAPYKRRMANILELNEESIDLRDPALQAAIGKQGDMNLFDYERMLRQDTRWQYTKQAREEVANIALSVLRDFGFQG